MSFDLAQTIFNQVDTNRDGTIDRNEFSNWLSNATGGAGFGSSSSYESSALLGSGGYGAGASYGAGGSYGAGASYGAGGSYGAGVSYGAGGSYGGASSYESSSASYNSGGVVQTYPTDSQGLFIDNNPQIIRRPAAGGVQTYTQNIRVRFLQPPPLPPPGPLIIKEVRPPQPPVPPPLRIRQQAPALPQQPPLILRERPPQPPVSVASQTVIRRLAALPVPPRSVIIERLPPLPPRPRDIIIERWIPYGAQAKRRTIVQRAPNAKAYAAPRNVIIQYEPAQVRVVRQFQRLGVTQANPQSYFQQYGAVLLDATTLVQQARSAGVVEDISPPAGAGVAVGFSSATYGQEAGFGVGGDYGVGAASYDQSSFSSSSGGYGGDVDASFGNAGFVGGGAGTYEGSSSSFEASSFDSGSFGADGFDLASAVFRSIDTNKDGTIDQNEFARFFQQGL